MFRKMLVAAVLTVSSLMVTTANAAPNYGHEAAHHCYKVFVRDHCNKPWRYYGEYHNHDQAHHVAHQLRHQGYEVEIRG